jgi:hypothetical protein
MSPTGQAVFNVVARPRSLFTFEFDCFDAHEQIIASFRHRAFRSSGEIDVSGASYTVARQGVGLAVHPVDSDDSVVSMAPEGRGQLTVSWDRRSITLARAGIGFRMILISKGGPIGRLGLRDLFGRTMILDCDEELPPVVVGSLFWLAVARRRQLLMVGAS